MKFFYESELILVRVDFHCLFPKDYLKKNGLDKYNQIANYVFMQSEINIKSWKSLYHKKHSRHKNIIPCLKFICIISVSYYNTGEFTG